MELQTSYTKKEKKNHIKINNIASQIEEIIRHHQKCAIIRSRTKFVENQEKPTKFFCIAEKQNQNKKIITKLQKKKGELQTEDKEILKTA